MCLPESFPCECPFSSHCSAFCAPIEMDNKIKGWGGGGGGGMVGT